MSAIIWSKPQCPQCDRAKTLLQVKGIEYEERKIGDQWTKEQLLEAVPAARSVPQVFFDEKYVGGYKELEKFLNSL